MAEEMSGLQIQDTYTNSLNNKMMYCHKKEHDHWEMIRADPRWSGQAGEESQRVFKWWSGAGQTWQEETREDDPERTLSNSETSKADKLK